VFAAMLATILQEGLENRAFLQERTVGFETVRSQLVDVPVDEYCRVADVEPALVRRVARGFAAAEGACVRSDLGLQQSRHSTLNLYLEKLLYLVTGHFGKRGAMAIHAQTLPLLWDSDPSAPGFDELRLQVSGMIPIAGFYPPNNLPGEIDSDHPRRTRGLIVDSANPVVTGADTQAYRRAFSKLDLLVVIDKDMTDTAELAHVVLPASTQFEKYDATFFNWGFPDNHQHVRHPVLPPTEGTLPEQEIYYRLAVAMGEDFSTNPLLGPLMQLLEAPPVQALPEPMRKAAAPLLFACMQFVERHHEAVIRAGIADEGHGLAAALFRRMVSSPSGTIISRHEYEDTFSFIRHADGKIHLAVPLMFEWLDDLRAEAARGPAVDEDYPFTLCAGERRSSNATTNYRDPAWRTIDPLGTLRIHAGDAARCGIGDGDLVECESRRGRILAHAAIDETVLPGALSLPHGFGLRYTTEQGDRASHGPLINVLTASDFCDPLTMTPFHKNVPVRIRKANPATAS
jgi:anaerobic selenocysteine-containing dehydrogenase